MEHKNMAEKVTYDWVRAQCSAIVAIQNDDEAAHSAEDRLHRAVLRAIAEGQLTGEEAQDCANLALSTQNLTFARWCA